ncbi:hypothetical protein ABPG75_010041 [Micractinium tetrahymenae]
MSEQAPREWGTWKLVAAASGSVTLGLLLGYKWGQRSAAAAAKKRRVPKLVYGARLGPAAGTGSGGSAESTPAATPRALSREDSAHGAGMRMVLLIRTDAALTPKELAEQSARAVLGLFKKQFKRRDPHLRPWEEGGSRIKVVAVSSQEDMLAKQAAARAQAIATHTFAGADRMNKVRTVMAIGPAPTEQLDDIVAALPEMA